MPIMELRHQPLENVELIDSSKVEVNTNNDMFRGLPDTNDYSKHKDFYAFYLWNYCSGKLQNGDYYVDFCSQPRQSLYDLFRFWKVWGASVHKEGTRFYWLEKGPKLLYVSYLVAGGTNALEFLAGVPSLYTNRVSRVTVVLASAASICLLATAILAQVTYGQLISRADDEDIPITAKKVGQILYAANWVGTIFSLSALATWYHVLTGNTVKRAPTMEATSNKHVQVVEADGHVQPYFVESPVRKRTFSKWPQF
ncbi:hypothetical protein H2199_004243 [Coniosporium tulheliwenetii]|uniref:Uncharacterized protein n=1 Tax=Coniosporium tulheliwenetii TaxID=3383036 RepID=A0ACC2Z7S2_9PEZI|nr:hypothetical protein H2199_004243 [Cladosporium sp. JES 115]